MAGIIPQSLIHNGARVLPAGAEARHLLIGERFNAQAGEGEDGADHGDRTDWPRRADGEQHRQRAQQHCRALIAEHGAQTIKRVVAALIGDVLPQPGIAAIFRAPVAHADIKPEPGTPQRDQAKRQQRTWGWDAGAEIINPGDASAARKLLQPSGASQTAFDGLKLFNPIVEKPSHDCAKLLVGVVAEKFNEPRGALLQRLQVVRCER